MALVLTGGGVSQLSGKMGGTVFARNRSGAYARNWAKPINPNTARQVAVRSRLAQLVQVWNEILTEAQRTAWNAYASAVPVVNRLGASVFLTGINMFVRSNSLILQFGGTRVDTAPALLLLGEQDPTLTVTASEASQTLSVTFDNTQGWAGEVGGYLGIFVGKPCNTNLNFFNGPWQYAGKISGAETPPTSPATVATSYALVAGQKLFAQARIVRADGRVGNPFRNSCTVGA